MPETVLPPRCRRPVDLPPTARVVMRVCATRSGDYETRCLLPGAEPILGRLRPVYRLSTAIPAAVRADRSTDWCSPAPIVTSGASRRQGHGDGARDPDFSRHIAARRRRALRRRRIALRTALTWTARATGGTATFLSSISSSFSLFLSHEMVPCSTRSYFMESVEAEERSQAICMARQRDERAKRGDPRPCDRAAGAEADNQLEV